MKKGENNEKMRVTFKQIKKIVFVILSLIISIVLTKSVISYAYYYNITMIDKSELDEMNLDKYNKLMIVAHPDDESLWGGGHLLQGDYLVVCMTNKSNPKRNKEFNKAVKYSKDKPLILDYPDKVYGKRDDWSHVEKYMKADLKTIMNYKKWDEIVTHNQNGEYGHQHHRLLHSYVTEIYDEELDNFQNKNTKLEFFGKYYTKKRIKKLGDKVDSWNTLDEQVYEEKINNLIPNYSTQKRVCDKFEHMMKYENFITYIPGNEKND